MSQQLILVPTALELGTIQTRMLPRVDPATVQFALCGFGPIAAAARAAELIATWKPQRVILVGIAGTYAGRIPLGSASCFEQVACYGVGAGTGELHRSVEQIGWAHWQSATPMSGTHADDLIACDALSGAVAGKSGIGDSIRLAAQPACQTREQIITCCAASSDDRDVLLRLAMYPHASAEDMEGFGVALACALAGVPCAIVRGISNQAGDRDKSAWKIAEALQAAADLAAEVSHASLESEFL